MASVAAQEENQTEAVGSVAQDEVIDADEVSQEAIDADEVAQDESSALDVAQVASNVNSRSELENEVETVLSSIETDLNETNINPETNNEQSRTELSLVSTVISNIDEMINEANELIEMNKTMEYSH